MKNQLKKILGKRQGERDLTAGLRMRPLSGKKLLQEKWPLEKHLAGEMEILLCSLRKISDVLQASGCDILGINREAV